MIHDITELKHLRKQLGITQSELSKLAGVSQSLIAKIEAGSIDPTYSRARRLMETLQGMSSHHALQVKDVMNRKVIAAEPGQDIREVIRLMKRHSISQLPVIERLVPVGLITESLILDAVIDEKTAVKVEEIMDDAPPVVSENASSAIASDLLRHCSIVLVAEKGKPVGVVTKSDIIQKAIRKRN